MARVKVEGIREVTAAATALRAVDRTVKTQAGRALRDQTPRIWSESTVQRFSRTAMDRAVFSGTRARASSSTIRLEAGTSPTIGADIAAAVEYGDSNKTYETYSRKGHKVTRRTQEQLPAPVRGGRVVGPAFKQSLPRLLSLYVSTVVRTIHEALEGR